MSLKLFKLIEPTWWQQLIVFMNNYVNAHSILSKLVPLTADIFVFTYPVYISAIYLLGIRKKDDFYKNAALYIFFSWISSVMLNLFIQVFVDKARPESILSRWKLLLDHIPDASFPSDHAAMSAAIAMSIMLWWMKNNNKKFIYTSFVFWIFCITMSLSRIAAWVHWPTDIIFGMLVWIIIPLILINEKVYSFLHKYIFTNIIALEKFIFRKIFQIQQ